MLVLRAAAIRAFHRVLLDQHPAIAAFAQCTHEFVGDVGMIWQCHLGRREAADALQRLETEQSGKVVLPGPQMQPIVLHRRRGRDGMPPPGPQPLDLAAVARIAGDGAQRVEHVAEPHLTQAPEQRARIIQHDARLLALFDQLGHELAHPLVAPVEHGGIATLLVVPVLSHHVLEVAGDFRRAQIVAATGISG